MREEGMVDSRGSLGLSVWETVRGWRDEMLAQFGLTEADFDGSDREVMANVDAVVKWGQQYRIEDCDFWSLTEDTISAKCLVGVDEAGNCTRFLDLARKVSPEETRRASSPRRSCEVRGMGQEGEARGKARVRGDGRRRRKLGSLLQVRCRRRGSGRSKAVLRSEKRARKGRLI
jgi:hypothetical protein